MLCLNCGEDISGDAVCCPHCGCQTYFPKSYRTLAEVEPKEKKPVSPKRVQPYQPPKVPQNRQQRPSYEQRFPAVHRQTCLAYNPFHSPKKRGIAALLCLFLGCLGIHRFYVGKIGTGILWMLTFGLYGIGALVDLLVILCGSFRDRDGRRLARW